MTPEVRAALEADEVMSAALHAMELSRNVEGAARRRAVRTQQEALFDDAAPDDEAPTFDLQRLRRGAEIRLSSCMLAGCPKSETLEQHHTFPVWVAGPEIADLMPIVTLCADHHRLWHRLVDETA